MPRKDLISPVAVWKTPFLFPMMPFWRATINSFEKRIIGKAQAITETDEIHCDRCVRTKIKGFLRPKSRTWPSIIVRKVGISVVCSMQINTFVVYWLPLFELIVIFLIFTEFCTSNTTLTNVSIKWLKIKVYRNFFNWLLHFVTFQNKICFSFVAVGHSYPCPLDQTHCNNKSCLIFSWLYFA